MNLGTLRTQTADFCGDAQQTRYTATQYLTALNRAQEQFAQETKALWKDTTWATVSGTATYDLPSDFMWEDWLTYYGYELKPISRHELQRLSPGRDWTADSGTPTNYIIDPEEAQKKMRLYPIPNEAQTVSMRYFPLPTALASDSDTPLNSSALMAQFHIGLAAYAAWLLLSGEEVTPPVAAKKNEMSRIYADVVGKAVDSFKNTASAGIKIKGSRLWR